MSIEKMPLELDSSEVTSALHAVQSAAEQGHLTPSAVDNIRAWLTQSRYSEYVAPIVADIRERKWSTLEDFFYTKIKFGTGGLRGTMHSYGSNAVNDRTIGESALGLARYVRAAGNVGDTPRCAIAYDTRHNSRRFACLCAEIMVQAGFQVILLQPHRSTPELSFAVRHHKCHCGIMVTASHNPPSDNAVKCYWSTGGQLVAPHDQGVVDAVARVEEIPRACFEESLAAGRIVDRTAETDAAFIATVSQQAFPGPRGLRVVYSPLHGVGGTAVPPVLAAVGFDDVEVFAPHADPNGDFPNVPGHVSNPENPAVFDAIITRGKEIKADIVLATDPDCDRVGLAAPLTLDVAGPWKTFTGNQIGALLTDYVLEQRRRAGTLRADSYLVKTLVTTDFVRRIGESYRVDTMGNLLVGFKFIGETMDLVGADKFVLGTEESHGYLVGQYARDKDAAVASLLLCELAAAAKQEGKSLHEKLDSLYWQHGYHAERLINRTLTGSAGMAEMKALMAEFRSNPPAQIGGLAVTNVRDYLAQTTYAPGETGQPMVQPPSAKGDMIMFDLAKPGNYVAARPSGTEPKVKFYLFTYVPAEQLADLETTKQEMQLRLDAMQADLVG